MTYIMVIQLIGGKLVFVPYLVTQPRSTLFVIHRFIYETLDDNEVERWVTGEIGDKGHFVFYIVIYHNICCRHGICVSAWGSLHFNKYTFAFQQPVDCASAGCVSAYGGSRGV